MTPRTLTASESETLRQAHDLFLSIKRPRAATLRTAIPAHPYGALDPYKAGIDAQRLADAKAAATRTHQPTPRPTEMPLDANGIPDPYFNDLQKLRSNR